MVINVNNKWKSISIVQSASTNKTVKSALEIDEKIGYKHSHAPFVSKLTFCWFTPLLWRGYKDPLEIDDLGNLHESETCRAQYDRFQYVYRSYPVRRFATISFNFIYSVLTPMLNIHPLERLNVITDCVSMMNIQISTSIPSAVKFRPEQSNQIIKLSPFVLFKQICGRLEV